MIIISITSLDFLKALAVLIFLFSFTKRELKILMSLGTSEIKTNSKTPFSNRLFISFYLNSINRVGIRKMEESFSCRKMDISAIF